MKITYLFGAGASRNALPIVNEIPLRIRQMITFLKSDENKLSNSENFDEIESSKSKIQQILIQDLEWILIQSENHASIDTFAKKLYIKRKNDDLKRLKAAFSVYLIFEQIVRKADIRYDSFFASLLTDSIMGFPPNLRILSWNYDFQFEKSFSEYTDQNEIYYNQQLLNIITKYSHDNPDNKRFSILKLNGSTNLLQDSGWREYNFFTHFQDTLTITFIEEVIRNFTLLRFGNKKLFSGLSFAWERYGDKDKDIVNYAKSESNDTEILVVIGYSFPYFNREIDREIIGNMKYLKKVYFQAPDAEILKERFLSIRSDLDNDKLLVRHDVGQFLLPNEL